VADFNLAGFAAHLGKLIIATEVENYHLLDRAARMVQEEAKAEIGTKQDAAGPFAAWAPLADTTVNGFNGHPGKRQLGFTPPDYDPLERSGEMRDSIERTVIPASHEAHVGSDSDVAVVQELGTEKMPARSFLGGAAVRKRDEVGHMIGWTTVQILRGGSRSSSDTKIP
jgi:hypothetical protein